MLNPEIPTEQISDKGIVLGKLSPSELQGEADLTRWARFLAARTNEDLAEAAKEDTMIEQARETLERLSADPKVQQMVRRREEGEFLYRVDLTEARKEAEARGQGSARLCPGSLRLLSLR